MQAPETPKYVSPPGVWKTKLVFRIASLVLLVVIAGLGGSLAATDRVRITYFMVVLAPALVVAFLWNTVEVVAICRRGGNRGIHPGAVVAVDLLAWLGWLVVDFIFVMVAISARSYIENWSGYQRDYQSDDYPYRSYDPSKVTAEDLQLESEVKAKGRAILVFISLNVLAHFTLFVIACYETSKRNRIPKTIYVMQPVYGPPPPTMPGQYQHQHLQAIPMQPHPAYYPQVAPEGSQMPRQPPAAQASETKGGPERWA